MADGRVIFKGEDYSEDLGEDFGSVFVVHDESQPGEPGSWMARSQARELAAQLGYSFDVDGMTDEELDEFKRGHGYPPGTRATDMTPEQVAEFMRKRGFV